MFEENAWRMEIQMDELTSLLDLKLKSEEAGNTTVMAVPSAEPEVKVSGPWRKSQQSQLCYR